jgi:hypothetical protein
MVAMRRVSTYRQFHAFSVAFQFRLVRGRTLRFSGGLSVRFGFGTESVLCRICVGLLFRYALGFSEFGLERCNLLRSGFVGMSCSTAAGDVVS